MGRFAKKLFATSFMMAFFASAVNASSFTNVPGCNAKEFAGTVNGVKQDEDSAKIKAKALLLNDTLSTLKVTKIIQTNENGEPLRNDDGTEKYYYFLTDINGTVYDANSIDKILKERNKLWLILGAKVGGGAALRILKSVLNKEKASNVAKSAAIGGAAGLALSTTEIAQITKTNKNLKKIRKSLEAYKETFTEEGLPKDPNADLSKVKGLGDLDKAEPLSKEATELRAELDKSIASANSLESLNLSSILKK